MVSKGRKPVPTKLKKLAGNPGQRPLNEQEPLPDAAIPEMPDCLDKIAAKEWDRITLELFKLGLLSEIDMAALAGYCQQYGLWYKASKKLQKQGLIEYTEKGYPIQNPMVGVVNKALERMAKMLVEFGMTPSSRSRVGASTKASTDDGKGDKWKGIL